MSNIMGTHLKKFIEQVRTSNKRQISKRTADILFQLLFRSSVNDNSICIAEIAREDYLYTMLMSANTIPLLLSLNLTKDNDNTYTQYSIISCIYSTTPDMVICEFTKEFSDVYANFVKGLLHE